jgi:nitrite reductase/ring-hydroxylating ferredoxin subunit
MIVLCAADTLAEGGDGHRWDVLVDGQPSSAFVIRHSGQVHGYLNRCAHVAMELDWLPGAVFDPEARYLMCATHGALYEPANGRCAGGPCLGRGGLRKLDVHERDGLVYWRPDAGAQPVSPPAAGCPAAPAC